MVAGGRSSADYTRCPACGRRTVLYRLGRGGEDYLACTWRGCGWETYRWPADWDTQGLADLQRWKQANGLADDTP